MNPRVALLNLLYSRAVTLLRITDPVGVRPINQAQNKDVMYDLPALGGRETASLSISPSAIRWNCSAIA